MTESSSSNPHDAYVRRVFSRPAAAAAFFRFALPPELGREIAKDRIELLSSDSISPKLDESRGDLMYRVRGRSRDFVAILILEHQSSFDRRMPLRLLRYQTAAWEQIEQDSGSSPIPFIDVTVLYHGHTPWRGRRRFLDLYSDDPAETKLFAASALDFGYRVVDLGVHPDEDLLDLVDSGSPDTGLSLLGLKWSRRRELNARLGSWIERAREGPISREELQAWRQLAVYLSKGSPLGADELYRTFQRASAKEYQEMGKTAAEELMERGEARLLRRSLLKLLQKTGQQTPEREARIESADSNHLQHWLDETILSGADLAALIDANASAVGSEE